MENRIYRLQRRDRETDGKHSEPSDFNPNSIAQKAALEALQGPQDAVAAMREEFDQRRKYMYERVSQMPLCRCA